MLIPMDFDFKRPMTSGLSVEELVAALERCKADSRLCLFDANTFENAVDGRVGIGKNEKGLMVLPPRTALFYAAKPGFKAYESTEIKGGIFTHFLVKGLLGEADRKGDSNGVVGLAELYLYVKSQSTVMSQSAFNQAVVPGLIISNDIDDLFDMEISKGEESQQKGGITIEPRKDLRMER